MWARLLAVFHHCPARKYSPWLASRSPPPPPPPPSPPPTHTHTPPPRPPAPPPLLPPPPPPPPDLAGSSLFPPHLLSGENPAAKRLFHQAFKPLFTVSVCPFCIVPLTPTLFLTACVFVLDLVHAVGGNSSIFPWQLFLRYCSFSAMALLLL